MIDSETIAAIATGMNTAGIGIIRISGAEAFLVARKLFRLKNQKELHSFESHHVYYGFIYDNEELIDEVLLLPMKGPNSFTKEDTIEIDCHGGILVMSRILETVIKHGARAAEPGEFTKRAFLNGRIDLSKAEAIIDLIYSKNDYAMKNSVNQLNGKLYDEIKKLREQVIYEISFIESALDDPEHIDLDEHKNDFVAFYDQLNKKLISLSSSFHIGRIINEGIKTVIAGKPNVGKSSFLNLLIGEDKAIVTEIPGTTRDVLQEYISIEGIGFNILDTAGIRKTEDLVEKIGVEKAKNHIDDADLIIYIIDNSNKIDQDDYDIIKLIKDKKCIVLLNKSDVNSCNDIENIHSLIQSPIIEVSVKENSGIDRFIEEIKNMFFHNELQYNDEILISNERHKFEIDSCIASLKEIKKSLDNQLSEDFFTIDLMSIYASLGRIIGEEVEDDLVNTIFSKFCMGK